MPQLANFASVLSTAFSSDLAEMIEKATLPSLGDGPDNADLANLLATDDPASHLADAGPRQAELTSGLWLLAGDLDRSHSISQDLSSAEGSFLHGIMHRREGDFGNAKYWFRRVGDHPVLDQISQQTDPTYSDPFNFADNCQDAIQAQNDVDLEKCVQIQWIEWQSLMIYLC